MSALFPRKTWDRGFVAWLVFLATLSALGGNWNAAMGWASAAIGWFCQAGTSDLLEDAMDLVREQS